MMYYSLGQRGTRLMMYIITPDSITTLGAVNGDGLTPLGNAVRWGQLDSIKCLISEFNVDVNGKSCASFDSRLIKIKPWLIRYDASH